MSTDLPDYHVFLVDPTAVDGAALVRDSSRRTTRWRAGARSESAATARARAGNSGAVNESSNMPTPGAVCALARAGTVAATDRKSAVVNANVRAMSMRVGLVVVCSDDVMMITAPWNESPPCQMRKSSSGSSRKWPGS
jgi:hypothetical protein